MLLFIYHKFAEGRCKPMRVRLLIKELAQAQGMKQYELAEKSGVTPQLLNRYWNNNVQRVDLEELNKIAKALGVRPGDLIAADDDLANAA
jgi:DNA-binding Xre family transcriptional regulator